jgi:hypothetical protein
LIADLLGMDDLLPMATILGWLLGLYYLATYIEALLIDYLYEARKRCNMKT